MKDHKLLSILQPPALPYFSLNTDKLCSRPPVSAVFLQVLQLQNVTRFAVLSNLYQALKTDRIGLRNLPLCNSIDSARLLENEARPTLQWKFQERLEGGDQISVEAPVIMWSLSVLVLLDGWDVHVIERDLTEPNRIAGELLQPGGYNKLIELGLEDCVEGIDAQKVLSLAAIYKDEKKAIVPYPSGVGARGFHNGRFIQKLRGKAASLPNVRLEQGTVTSLLEENGTIKGVQYKTKAGKELTASAPLTMVCDGCFSNLRRSLCNPKIEIPSCFIGLVLENCDLPHSNRGYFILKDITAIAFPIGTNEIRCLVDFPGRKIPSISNGEMTEYLKTVVAPQMPAELYNAFTCAIDKGNIRTMPNRIMSESHYPVPGAFLIGDS
uniref:Squalene monooxygenase n=1 Tax=Salix viminalis TaxID=40686 RepID=A0A6N2L3F8_SALVM